MAKNIFNFKTDITGKVNLYIKLKEVNYEPEYILSGSNSWWTIEECKTEKGIKYILSISMYSDHFHLVNTVNKWFVESYPYTKDIPISTEFIDYQALLKLTEQFKSNVCLYYADDDFDTDFIYYMDIFKDLPKNFDFNSLSDKGDKYKVLTGVYVTLQHIITNALYQSKGLNRFLSDKYFEKSAHYLDSNKEIIFPEWICVITDKNFKNSLNIVEYNSEYFYCEKEDMAYLLPAHLFDEEFKEDKKEDKFDIVFLHYIFSALLNLFVENNYEELPEECRYYIDLKELLKATDIDSNPSFKDIQNIENKLFPLEAVVGVFNKEDYAEQLFYYVGYDPNLHKFSFVSPYLTKLVNKIYQHGQLDPNKPLYSNMIKASILKERNKSARELVFNTVQFIEQHQDMPNVKLTADILLKSSPILNERYNNAGKNQDRVLATAFQKFWQLLKEYTTLEEKYDIYIPQFYPEKKYPQFLPCNQYKDLDIGAILRKKDK